jgi:DNA modification methylase
VDQVAFITQPSAEAYLLTLSEAAVWATGRVKRNVTASNISYLIQYGRVKKIESGKSVYVSMQDLENYYDSYDGNRENSYKSRLGEDINWSLSFSHVKESESTKHVHRLHPYKGKFIPHLVEYFIDSNTDNFKKDIYFRSGDTILDPFAGSGTTMVQANECNMNAVGIDISAFNALIANCKVANYDLSDLKRNIEKITLSLKDFTARTKIAEFDARLLMELNLFNNKYFPVPEYKYRLRQGEIDECTYGAEKEALFLPIYNDLIQKYGIKLHQNSQSSFLEKWFSQQIREEIDFTHDMIKQVENRQTKNILAVILSRTMRSCRATTHSDLATLVDPVTSAYYCSKHGKICKPLFSIVKWWDSYCRDTFSRLAVFSGLRTQTTQYCITGDSRNVNIFKELRKADPSFANLVSAKKIAGIFSSPPYVGMIDYHEQHAYAYDLFGFERQDGSEIGPLFKGKGKAARQSYAEGISDVLLNCKTYMAENYNVFLVANDKYDLYPAIAEKAGMTIIDSFRRPVLNRSERDQTVYSETIFHLKERS